MSLLASTVLGLGSVSWQPSSALSRPQLHSFGTANLSKSPRPLAETLLDGAVWFSFATEEPVLQTAIIIWQGLCSGSLSQLCWSRGTFPNGDKSNEFFSAPGWEPRQVLGSSPDLCRKTSASTCSRPCTSLSPCHHAQGCSQEEPRLEGLLHSRDITCWGRASLRTSRISHTSHGPPELRFALFTQRPGVHYHLPALAFC